MLTMCSSFFSQPRQRMWVRFAVGSENPLRRRSGLLIMMVNILMYAGAASASAQSCPNIVGTGTPRWTFTQLEYHYSGGLTLSYVMDGVQSWNPLQSKVTFSYGVTWDDVNITDDTSITGLGESQTYNYGNGGSARYLHKSIGCTNVCFNTSRTYFEAVRLNANNIGGAGYDWAPIWGMSGGDAVNLVTKNVAAHEVGHSFGLENWDGSDTCGVNTTIMSVNDQFYCKLSGPTSCDASAANSYYSGWTTVDFNTCGTCSLSTSCSN